MNPATRSILLAPYTPVRLFSGGQQGAWFDPSDMSTLFQDSAGTTPVTATGQPVGKMLDKSGRGNHATQATAGSRPIFQRDSSGFAYLAADGAATNMATGSINFGSSDKVSIWAGTYKNSDVATGMIVELSASSDSNAGAFYLAGSLAAAANYEVELGTATNRTLTRTSAAYPAGSKHVHAIQLDHAGTTNAAQVGWQINNGPASRTDSGTLAATGAFGNYPLFLFARGGTSLFYNGRFYGAVIVGAAATANQSAQIAAWMNRKTGAY